jgi:hypothetical protein
MKMKIEPETLKTLRWYNLENAMKQANCTPEDKAEICQYILENNELLQSLTPHFMAVQIFVEIFSKNVDSSLEEKIFHTLTSEQVIARFSSYGWFKSLYDLFINNKLPQEEQSKRCLYMLDQYLKLSDNWIKDKIYLPDFISAVGMQDLILDWAERNKVIQSPQDRVKILEKVSKLQKEIEEKRRTQELADQIKEVKSKKSSRPRAQLEVNPLLTELHNIIIRSNDKIYYPKEMAQLIQNVGMLIQNGASLETRDQYGATPLISATIAGNLRMTLVLLSWGAKVFVMDQDGYMPKFFQLFYQRGDHDYSSGKSFRYELDNSIRNFLEKIELLEKSYLINGTTFYSFEQIKTDLLSIINDKTFEKSKPLAALCGYIVNNVAEHEQKAVCQFFKDNCKVDISTEHDLLVSFNNIYSAPQEAPLSPVSVATMAAYRSQLHGNNNNSSSINTALTPPEGSEFKMPKSS